MTKQLISNENANIKIFKIENGYQVFFPYALKDSFKLALPSAKWDSTQKCWTVGVRSLKKVQAWAETAESLVKDMIVTKQAMDDLESTEQEFSQALAELETLRTKLKSVREITAKKQATLAKLNEIRPQIEKAKIELGKAKAEQDKAELALAELVDGLIDMNAINNAIATMTRMRKSAITSKNRAVFEQAQEVINEQRQNLKQAGFGSRGLDDLWRINWNRPDRDRIGDCRKVDDFYRIDTE